MLRHCSYKAQCDVNYNNIVIIFVLKKVYSCQTTTHGNGTTAFGGWCWALCSAKAVWGPVNHLRKKVVLLLQQTESSFLFLTPGNGPMKKKKTHASSVIFSRLDIFVCSSVSQVKTSFCHYFPLGFFCLSQLMHLKAFFVPSFSTVQSYSTGSTETHLETSVQ